jgi:DNA-binding transcriptional MerR regulator
LFLVLKLSVDKKLLRLEVKMLEKSISYENNSGPVSHQLRDHAAFSGSAGQLLCIVENLAPALHLEPEGDSGNERLLRHYASVNVLDKPARQGREAVYTYRHLLQFLTARRLMKQGFALSKIAEFTSVVPTETLQQTLQESPQRSEAELLVAAYKASRPVESVPALARRGQPPRPSAQPAPVRPDPLFGMADVMHEIEKMRARFMVEIQAMQAQVQRSLRGVEKTSEILDRLQVDSAKNLDWVIREKRESQARLEDHLARLSYLTEQMHERSHDALREMGQRFTQLEAQIQSMHLAIESLQKDCTTQPAQKGSPS